MFDVFAELAFENKVLNLAMKPGAKVLERMAKTSIGGRRAGDAD